MFLLVTSTLGGWGGYHAVYSVLSVTAGEALATTLVPIIGPILQLTVSQQVCSCSSSLFTLTHLLLKTIDIIGMVVSPNKGRGAATQRPRRPSLSEVKQPKIHP